jgi:hypothetical protein
MQAGDLQEASVMAKDDLFGKRDQEEDYFRKKDRELIERMRKAADEAARSPLSEQTGIQDPELLRDLEALGFTAETVSLLPLVPILQVAWAEGGVSAAERKLIVDVARHRGITEGSPADKQLTEWLAHQPSADVFARADRLVAAMLAAHAGPAHDLTADDLMKYCESIAHASGGILGLGSVSHAERAAIEEVHKALKSR